MSGRGVKIGEEALKHRVLSKKLKLKDDAIMADSALPPREKKLIPLYGVWQTELLKPLDLLPNVLDGCEALAKRLSIDFAKAVIGYTFSNGSARPRYYGIVVSSDDARLLRDVGLKEERIFHLNGNKAEERQKIGVALWRSCYYSAGSSKNIKNDQKSNINCGNIFSKCSKLIVSDRSILAYGQSDEYSFIFGKDTTLFKRREAKILTTVVSTFTAHYVQAWNIFFPDKKMLYPPSFDGRIVLYPSDMHMKDYLRWRQVDCHINNLYNTTFWALVKDELSPQSEVEAQAILKDTDSAAKNEILFSKFNINYNTLPAIFRKGTLLRRTKIAVEEAVGQGLSKAKIRPHILVEHIDIINEAFWQQVGL
ncbi:tRNA-His guanylyltransferase [Dinochytrium kinnereticum]|nr:tRNA-His guanylyltransferase [Dinochytrium kinnereticum]